MRRFLLAVFLLTFLIRSVDADSRTILRTQRSMPGDLEVGGDLVGLPAGSTRYVSYEDLLKLPQETYSVSDDLNLPHNTVISGVALTTLARLFGQTPKSTLIVAICYDRYRTNYPLDYLAEHHPVLVLRINGKLRDQWPRAARGDSFEPYLISHPLFRPAFKVLSHEDEPQIPYGVTRLEFRRESLVFGSIRPHGNDPVDLKVNQGYRIARQDCFRCHNSGSEGGQMSGKSWRDLGGVASTDPVLFKRIIHDPASVTPGTKMQAEPGYDDATLEALTAYFKTFSPRPVKMQEKP
jgi:hypothetical protein